MNSLQYLVEKSPIQMHITFLLYAGLNGLDGMKDERLSKRSEKETGRLQKMRKTTTKM